ncbi:hypothetical protein JB92DRAFT_2833500 [Gautieria morchelliformis]|nr:hypothetical protein JB92DRAFT_2833500 [Gautieria morchelliformis]
MGPPRLPPITPGLPLTVFLQLRELVEFTQLEKNSGALEQRRSVGLETLTWSGSLSSGPCLDPLIQAAILGSPSRRLRLADIQEAIERWSKAPLTHRLKQSIQKRLANSDLFARQPLARNENQWQRSHQHGWCHVHRSLLPTSLSQYSALTNSFGEFVKAEYWKPEEVPPFHPSEDVPPRDAWAGPSTPRYL